MVEPETLYKLMILYMLKKVNFPLSNPQLWTFFDEKGYTNYFTFQASTDALIQANLVHSEEVHNAVLYELTREGEEALYYFKNDIPSAVRQDMDDYISENKFQLRNETGITTNFYRTTDFDYCVHCKIREGKTTLFEMNLSVPTEEQAEKMATRFEQNAQQVYATVMKLLM